MPDLLPDYSKFLIHPNDIIFQNYLGEGNFGKVQKIIWRKSSDEHIPCACKSLKENENSGEFQKEIYNMLKFRHENVVIMYGVVMDPTKLLLVMEFCDGGSLIKRLTSIDKPKILVTKLKDFAHQIAKGLKYLARKNIVHNDIAARNILLSANETIVKIGDFGLARQLPPNQDFYLKQTTIDLPVPRMSPEAIIEKRFSTFSDIWSYGVLLYEMFDYGRIPWQGGDWKEILIQMTNRRHLEQPRTCPDSIFQLMEVCWSLNPYSRTNFDEIERVLSTIAFPIKEVKENEESDFPGGTKVIVVREIGDNLFYCQNIKNSRFGSIYGYLLKISETPQNLPSLPSSSETRFGDDSHESSSTRNDRSTSSTQSLLPLTKITTLGCEEPPGKKSIKEKNVKFLKIFGAILFFLGLFIAITIIFIIWNQKPGKISTTTQTEVNSKYKCPDWIEFAIASEEVTYIYDGDYVYKIQNQRVVKNGSLDDFFVQWEYPWYYMNSGYIRNGSLILLNGKKQVHIYDPIPMQSDKFKLREGFPKQTPIDMHIRGAIMINDKAYVFGGDYYLIYDERFNNVTTKMDLKINFPNFPMGKDRDFKGGHTTSFNGQKFLTLFTNNFINSMYSQVYTYDLERKNLVGGGKNLTEYLLNCV